MAVKQEMFAISRGCSVDGATWMLLDDGRQIQVVETTLLLCPYCAPSSIDEQTLSMADSSEVGMSANWAHIAFGPSWLPACDLTICSEVRSDVEPYCRVDAHMDDPSCTDESSDVRRTFATHAARRAYNMARFAGKNRNLADAGRGRLSPTHPNATKGSAIVA
ncbi:uncharacterized protein TRAVEDRAFT_19209 [Trametes versicolor FP-101664 SS1]|uniref:uncharacterized protein n=1 Tax=Trametes versicolor (strain FP-101664) TaxID=717944 RepID=UPI00046249C5|nr:uncharacterized protein TRAVEDRAFT_19209 [Trametes versicolor FP-101664 SS1]EIW60558.1 hypothetical protein TRAVEDRAFT_19209 [Trametes versicolor FP-101664 SS1]